MSKNTLQQVDGKAKRHFLYAAVSAVAVIAGGALLSKENISEQAGTQKTELPGNIATRSANVPASKTPFDYMDDSMTELVDFEEGLKNISQQERDAMLDRYARRREDLPYFDALLRSGITDEAKFMALETASFNLGQEEGTHWDAVRLILRSVEPSRALPDVLSRKFPYRSTTVQEELLESAVRSKNSEALEMVLGEFRIDPMAKDGRSLLLAAANFDWETVDVLLRYNATFSHDFGKNPAFIDFAYGTKYAQEILAVAHEAYTYRLTEKQFEERYIPQETAKTRKIKERSTVWW